MDYKKINLERVIEVSKKIDEINFCKGKGKSNPCENERQFLYGDVLDYIKDCYGSVLNADEIALATTLVIGNYVIKNTIL